MQAAIVAMVDLRHGGRGAQLALLCVALGFATANAAIADDIGTESPAPEEMTVTVILDGGLRYEGTTRNGRMHGEGKLSFPDGRIYEGELVNGQIEGQGTYTYPDARTYVGEFRDGKMHGKGVYTYANGRVREGVWKDGEPQQNAAPSTPR